MSRFIKNARMSRLGTQFYTTAEETEQVVSARRITTRRKRRKKERTHRLELDGDQRVEGSSVGQ